MSSKFRVDFLMHKSRALEVNTEAALKVLLSTSILWVQQCSLSLLSWSAVNLHGHSSSKNNWLNVSEFNQFNQVKDNDIPFHSVDRMVNAFQV